MRVWPRLLVAKAWQSGIVFTNRAQEAKLPLDLRYFAVDRIS